MIIHSDDKVLEFNFQTFSIRLEASYFPYKENKQINKIVLTCAYLLESSLKPKKKCVPTL